MRGDLCPHVRHRDVPAASHLISSVSLLVLLVRCLLHLRPGEGVVVQVPVIGRYVVQLVESLRDRDRHAQRVAPLPRVSLNAIVAAAPLTSFVLPCVSVKGGDAQGRSAQINVTNTHLRCLTAIMAARLVPLV